MKLEKVNRKVSSSGTMKTTAFQINATAHMFRILSDGLYSDKVRAVIREVSCNAYDSHPY